MLYYAIGFILTLVFCLWYQKQAIVFNAIFGHYYSVSQCQASWDNNITSRESKKAWILSSSITIATFWVIIIPIWFTVIVLWKIGNFILQFINPKI